MKQCDLITITLEHSKNSKGRTISFHGRGFAPSISVGISSSIAILTAVEALVGIIIELTLIATLTQRLFSR